MLWQVVHLVGQAMCLWFSAHFRHDITIDAFKQSLAHAAGYCSSFHYRIFNRSRLGSMTTCLILNRRWV